MISVELYNSIQYISNIIDHTKIATSTLKRIPPEYTYNLLELTSAVVRKYLCVN